MKNDKAEYLHLIQEPICRMSTVSAIFKGFSASIVAGLSAISYSSTNIWVLGLTFLPVLAFASLDIFYLKLERKYRYLYNQVRRDNHKINFSMKLPNKPLEIIKAKARTRDCVLSPSIYLFYPMLIIVLILVLIINLLGVF